MTLISFEDAVTAANLDPNQHYAVFYADGIYANRTAVAERCRHAKLFGITVRGRLGPSVFACDCEAGDLTVAQAEAWTAAQIRLGVKLICVYASLDTWLNQGLLKALEKYGPRIKRWVAHFDNVAQIPSWADADQFADPGPIDRDIALANFFEGISPVVPAHGTACFEGSVNLLTGAWSIHGIPGIDVHFAGPEEWESAEIQLCKGGDRRGEWRVRGVKLNAEPLGG